MSRIRVCIRKKKNQPYLRGTYFPTDCFENFPYPEQLPPANLSEYYHKHRRQIMLARQEGLTKTYNRFHNPKEFSADIAELRALHVAMDHAVAAAYGWGELVLGHGFHETAQGLRYTISDVARRAVLDRLLRLNHERAAEEAKEAEKLKLEGGGLGKGVAKGKGKRGKPAGQESLF